MNKAHSKIKGFFDFINKWLKGKSDFGNILIAKEQDIVKDWQLPQLPIQNQIQQAQEEDLLFPLLVQVQDQAQHEQGDELLLPQYHKDQISAGEELLPIVNEAPLLPMVDELLPMLNKAPLLPMVVNQAELIVKQQHLKQLLNTHQGLDALDEHRLEALLEKEPDLMDENPLIEEIEALDVLALPLVAQAPLMPSQTPKEKTGSILIKSGTDTINLKIEAWEVLCITLKLAKLFDPQRIEKLIQTPDILSIRELIQIKIHIESILFAVMGSGDYLMSDLTMSDTHPREAFVLENDPRRIEFIDRPTLNHFILFIKSARFPATVQRLQWKKEISMSFHRAKST